MKRLLAAIGIAFAFANAGQAQTYPDRTIRYIVPFAPGGGTDIIARMMAQKLTESLGQSVVVDNRSGAGGIIGTDLVAKSPADGYTLLMGTTSSLASGPVLNPKVPYNVLRDFAPISLVATGPHMLAVHPSLPVKSVKDLITLARKNPGQLSFAASSTGGSSHLSGAMFNVLAGTQMIHVPYRGTGPAAIAVVSGDVPVSFNDVLATLPHVRSGRLRGIAVTGVRRSPAVPDLPTIAEAGLPDYESGVWYGVLAPAKTPAQIIARLNAEVVKLAKQTDVRERLMAEGSNIVGSSPEEFSEYIKLEQKRWAKIIKEAKIQAE